MPISIIPRPHVNRRYFLKSLGMAGAGICLPQVPLLSQDEEASPQIWALLSDTHIDSDPEAVSRGISMTANLKQVVNELLEEKTPLEGVVINGDCAHLKGLEGDYRQLDKLLQPLRKAHIPVHLTLGNHDDRSVIRQLLKGEVAPSAYVENQHITVLEGRSMRWILLDTLRHVNQVEGELGPAQLDWLASYITTEAPKPTVLVGHHNPQFGLKKPEENGQLLKPTGLIDTDSFFDSLAILEPVHAYVFGHTHRWRSADHGTGVRLINLPPTAYVFADDAPNGWVRATADAQGLTLELRALNPQHPEHGSINRIDW